MGHLREIVYRLIYTFFSTIITFFCLYFFSEQLIYLLAEPASGGPFFQADGSGPRAPYADAAALHQQGR